MEIPPELVPFISQFSLEETRVTISLRDRDRWAIVRSGGFCMNRSGQWEYEPLPSSRSDDFIARTRFTLTEATEICRSKGWLGARGG
ncbi:hypothetical protein [Miltoncostaea oceani]|uniref:hypothetical protein n=1 Tax=Miltoncostaea oceani TaxID=2843216 RepID=UPI001C3D8665|nr:hypothetical protein [Miltoncostaea oceani]